MLAALAGRPSLHRGVAVVDPSIADAQLGRMHALGVRGIRFNLVSPVGNGPQELDALSRACANGAGTCCGTPMPRISKASRDGTSAAAWAACSTTWQACMRNCRRRMRPGSTWTAWPARVRGSSCRAGTGCAPRPPTRRCARTSSAWRSALWSLNWPHTAFAPDRLPDYASVWAPVVEATGIEAAEVARQRAGELYA